MPASTSDTDLWLDELEGLSLKMIDAGIYCEELGSFMAKARENAIKTFRSDLLANLKSHFRPRHEAYTGLLGQLSYRRNTTPSTEFIGHSLDSKRIKGSRVKIKRIGININASKDVAIKFYKRVGLLDSGQPEYQELTDYSQALTAVANTWSYKTVTDVTLDLWEDGYEETEYLIGYFPTTETHKDNLTDCGCGTRKNSLANYISFNGVSGTLENLNKTGSAHGLVLEVEMLCETTQIIDDNLIYPDFELVAAHAIRYKAGFFLTQYIIASNNTNIYTLINDAAQLFALGKGYEFEYQQRVKGWLSENIRINNDCYICRGPKMGGIR